MVEIEIDLIDKAEEVVSENMDTLDVPEIDIPDGEVSESDEGG